MFWKRWGNWKKRRYILGVLLISLMITGCAERTNRYQNLDSEKITIIATLFPQYDFAREIAKDYANVILLLPPGMESHSFDPSPADIIAIGNSDVFLYTGAYMEAWAEDIISGIHTKKVHVKDVSEHITLVKEEEIEQEHEAEHGHVYQEHEHEYDPHILTNPVYAMTMVENIKEALIEADPEHKEGYEKNADIYLKKLQELDSTFREIVENGKRTEIFFGGRFAMYYFAREYGLSYEAAYDSCSSETEPSAKALAHIVDEMRENQIPVIFYEELVNPKIAKTISQETESEMLLLHSCHNVTKDELEEGVSYLQLMWKNVENLKRALE